MAFYEVTLESPPPGEPAGSPATWQVAARLLRADGQTLWLDKLRLPASTRPTDVAERRREGAVEYMAHAGLPGGAFIKHGAAS